jgi:outer membrane protein assembly factor BamA
VTQQVVDNVTGRVLDRRRSTGSAGDAIQYAQSSAAFVGDNAVFGPASPLDGWRYRAEVQQTVGRTQFTGVTVDGRWYQPLWRGALAFRAMHTGRYGRDDGQAMLAPMFVGAGTLVRGYAAESLAERECGRSAFGPCPSFDGLLGSRMAVANVEYRLPINRLGVGGLAIEVAPFLDAGMAWRGGDALSLRPRALANADAVRRPVLSHGISARLNLGALIVEMFHARPVHRSGGGVFGLNLAPGW